MGPPTRDARVGRLVRDSSPAGTDWRGAGGGARDGVSPARGREGSYLMRSMATPMQFGNAILVVVTVLLLVGCHPSSPTSPTSTDSGTSTSGPSTSSVGPVHFDFDAGITDRDKATLETSVRLATDYFQRQFQRTLLGPVTVLVRNADGPFAVSATTGTTVVTVYVHHADWQTHGPMKRTTMMVHELYEVLQEEVGWPGEWGGWLQDGSADYVGDAVVIDAGMAGIDEVRQCQISNYFGSDGPFAPPLEEISFDVDSPTSSRYVIAWLAWDRLLNGPANTSKLAVYWNSGFESAFGQSEHRFYRDFEQYRRGLQPPDDNACASLDWR